MMIKVVLPKISFFCESNALTRHFIFSQDDEEDEPEDDQDGDEVNDLELQVKGVSLTPRQDAKVECLLLKRPNVKSLENATYCCRKILCHCRSSQIESVRKVKNHHPCYFSDAI